MFGGAGGLEPEWPANIWVHLGSSQSRLGKPLSYSRCWGCRPQESLVWLIFWGEGSLGGPECDQVCRTVWSWLHLHPHSSSRTRRSFPALSWVCGSRRLGGSGEVSLLAFSSSSSSATSSLDSFSSSWASVHSWGHGPGRKKSVNADQCPASTLSPTTTPRPPQESQPSALCAPHLLSVLRCPRVPQGQSATPAPSHGPYPMGVLAARAEGHEPSTARMNLSLG